jgi:hypothetical protein
MISVTHFDGGTYDHHEDFQRLKGQMLKVYELMRDGSWRTLREIADAVGSPEASVSARLRDLRKERYGSFQVERQRDDGGLHLYRVTEVSE